MNEFFELTPEKVLNAVESFGYRCTGRCLALNSLENRVYEVQIEDGTFLVAKFYRPKRWSLEQIKEEHSFLAELHQEDVLVVPPILFNQNSIIYLEQIDCYCALFPKFSGRMELESNQESLERLGRLIARMHLVGARTQFKHRPTCSTQWYLKHNLDSVLNFLPKRLNDEYLKIISTLEKHWSKFSEFKTIRLHGDCHRGNILWRPEGESLSPLLVDFDDSIQGPIIQDFWLLFPGRYDDYQTEYSAVIKGYEMFLDFDDRQIQLIETLRAFRMVQYSGWIAKRWQDPSFQKVFPDITLEDYWEKHIFDLNDQLVWI